MGISISDIGAQIQAQSKAAMEAAQRAAQAAARAAQQAAQAAASKIDQVAQKLAQVKQSSPAVRSYCGESSFEKAADPLRKGAAWLAGQEASALRDAPDIANPLAAYASMAKVGQAAWNWANPTGDLSYDKQIDTLKPGDRFGYSMDASGHAVVGAEGAQDVACRCDAGNPPQYVVSVDSRVTGGVFGDTGVEAGPVAADLKASMQAGGGVKTEYTFNSPEEAKRAMGVIDKMNQAAKDNATNPLKAGASFLTALQGTLDAPKTADQRLAMMSQMTGVSKEDLSFLGQHTSAMEFHADAIGKADGSLHAVVAQASAGGDVQASVTKRFEFEDGKPTALVVRADLVAQGDASVSGGPSLAKGAGKGSLSQTLGSADGMAKVTIEDRFELPKDMPAGASIDQVLPTCPKESSGTVLMEGAVQGKGVEQEFNFKGSPGAALSDPTFLNALHNRDLNGAMDVLGKHVKLEDAISTPYTQDTSSFSAGGSLEGFGASDSLSVYVRHYGERQILD